MRRSMHWLPSGNEKSGPGRTVNSGVSREPHKLPTLMQTCPLTRSGKHGND
jgi:hypothetical protein